MKLLSAVQSKKIIREAQQKQKSFSLFLDFDGTLSPIAPRPELATVSTALREILRRLACHPQILLHLVSGRSAKSVRQKLPLQNTVYAGNHGLEISGRGLKFLHPQAQELSKNMKQILRALKEAPKQFPGAWIEDKTYTLTCHYRQLDPKKSADFQAYLKEKVSPWLQSRKIKMAAAKKAIELRPNFVWNKGSAVKWLLQAQKRKTFPIYIGDDNTDEDAFKVVRGRGLAVRVGRGTGSAAPFYLTGPATVEKFLALLNTQIETSAKCVIPACPESFLRRPKK